MKVLKKLRKNRLSVFLLYVHILVHTTTPTTYLRRDVFKPFFGLKGLKTDISVEKSNEMKTTLLLGELPSYT